MIKCSIEALIDILKYYGRLFMNDGRIWNQKDYRRISSGRMIQFGDSQDIAFLSA